jgi:hypothetical protein
MLVTYTMHGTHNIKIVQYTFGPNCVVLSWDKWGMIKITDESQEQYNKYATECGKPICGMTIENGQWKQ